MKTLGSQGSPGTSQFQLIAPFKGFQFKVKEDRRRQKTKKNLQLGKGGRLARLRRARRPSRPRRGAAAPRTHRSERFVCFTCFRGRAEVFWDPCWVHLVPFGVYFGAVVVFIVLEVLFIGRDRCAESYLLERTVQSPATGPYTEPFCAGTLEKHWYTSGTSANP